MSKKLKILGFITIISSLVLTSCDTNMIQDRIEGTVNNMLPNLYVTLMQLLLFAITVAIFVFFAYKPVKKKLEQRANYIKNNIDESKKKNDEASKNLEQANEIVFQSQKKAGEIIQEAQITAENKAQTLEKELNKAIEDQRQQAHKDIEAERTKMIKEAKNEVIDAAINTSKAILKREITKEDNEQLINEFIDCLEKK